MIEEGIFKLITSSVDFGTLALSRLYPLLLPTESPLPAATYNVVSITPLYELTARVNFTKMRLQVDTWANTSTDAKNLATAVISAIDNFSGVLPGGTRVFGIQLRNATDYYEHEALIYRVMIEFDVQFAHTS